MTIKYRSEIDGLRAIAVLPVILFHAGFDVFGRGFLGVDIFFVISGYLITSLLLEDLHRGRFSIASFYERRARRLLPALYLVLICTSVMMYFVLLPTAYSDYAESVLSVIGFVSNFYFWSQSSYFSTESELIPLLHTWSLAVEEQYYIFFPVFLLVLGKYFQTFFKKFLFSILVSVAFVSFAISMVLAFNTGGSANFFFLLRGPGSFWSVRHWRLWRVRGSRNLIIWPACLALH